MLSVFTVKLQTGFKALDYRQFNLNSQSLFGAGKFEKVLMSKNISGILKQFHLVRVPFLSS